MFSAHSCSYDSEHKYPVLMVSEYDLHGFHQTIRIGAKISSSLLGGYNAKVRARELHTKVGWPVIHCTYVLCVLRLWIGLWSTYTRCACEELLQERLLIYCLHARTCRYTIKGANGTIVVFGCLLGVFRNPKYFMHNDVDHPCSIAAVSQTPISSAVSSAWQAAHRACSCVRAYTR